MMETPFPKSMSFARKYDQLLEIVESSDTMGILINADPDSMASAMALKRIFWKKARRVMIYRVNTIKRADNRAFVKFLTVDQKHIRQLKRSAIRTGNSDFSHPPINTFHQNFRLHGVI